MSFGAGHVADMMNRMKQNRAQRASSKPKFKDHNRESIYATHNPVIAPTFASVSPQELLSLKNSIRKRANAAHNKERNFYIVFISICILILLACLLWLN